MISGRSEARGRGTVESGRVPETSQNGRVPFSKLLKRAVIPLKKKFDFSG